MIVTSITDKQMSVAFHVRIRRHWMPRITAFWGVLGILESRGLEKVTEFANICGARRSTTLYGTVQLEFDVGHHSAKADLCLSDIFISLVYDVK